MTTTAKGRKLRHFDADKAFSKADYDEELLIEIPKKYPEFPGQWGC